LRQSSQRAAKRKSFRDIALHKPADANQDQPKPQAFWLFYYQNGLAVNTQTGSCKHGLKNTLITQLQSDNQQISLGLSIQNLTNFTLARPHPMTFLAVQHKSP
tara:strand:- start:57875 stop:58183 length:309 start_codon:yes stop_codon:yes gene_type:complete